jgi:hypothetical protein
MSTVIACHNCGAEVEAKRFTRKYCKRACQRSYRVRNHKSIKVKTLGRLCIFCGISDGWRAFKGVKCVPCARQLIRHKCASCEAPTYRGLCLRCYPKPTGYVKVVLEAPSEERRIIWRKRRRCDHGVRIAETHITVESQMVLVRVSAEVYRNAARC